MSKQQKKEVGLLQMAAYGCLFGIIVGIILVAMGVHR